MAYDRGAFPCVTFHRCERGFILRTGEAGLIPPVFAFDHIEDVAAWFVEQYGNPDDAEEITNG